MSAPFMGIPSLSKRNMYFENNEGKSVPQPVIALRQKYGNLLSNFRIRLPFL